jgi:hypothetical protein
MNPNRAALAILTALLASAVVAGCVAPAVMNPMRSLATPSSGSTPRTAYTLPDIGAMQQRQQFMQDLMANPDLPAWHDEREKLTMAQGDRVFDKPFDQVFDGMVVALATMGSRVNNMDRGTGYITGSLPDLGPERTQELQKESVAEYAQTKGYPPSVLQKQGMFDTGTTMSQSMMGRFGGSGLTLTMVRQSAQQTKVKVRFDNVFYPKTELELYQHVWVAVDKQMFLDRSLDH